MMRRALLLIFVSLVLGGCGLLDHHDDPTRDAGPEPPRYAKLDESSAALSISVAPDDQTAEVRIVLTSNDGAPVLLQDGQEIDANQLGLPQLDAGTYGKTIPGAATYAITVNEPLHGVLTTTYAPPAAFTITSAPFDLAGTQLAWSNPDPSAQVHIALSQQTPDGPQRAEIDLATDTGSRDFTDLELQRFVQGFPLSITVTKSLVGEPLQGVAQSQVTISRSRVVSVLPTSS